MWETTMWMSGVGTSPGKPFFCARYSIRTVTQRLYRQAALLFLPLRFITQLCTSSLSLIAFIAPCIPLLFHSYQGVRVVVAEWVFVG